MLSLQRWGLWVLQSLDLGRQGERLGGRCKDTEPWGEEATAGVQPSNLAATVD